MMVLKNAICHPAKTSVIPDMPRRCSAKSAASLRIGQLLFGNLNHSRDSGLSGGRSLAVTFRHTAIPSDTGGLSAIRRRSAVISVGWRPMEDEVSQTSCR
ncbi:hypothetical protein DPEC_G00046700 [Dallia pectoralis]|uniref:Uncharacterized protein n=1 Tax=Dallia pectoralis TaxID=75939 RepID=A0ACC2HAL5_DALPE|nr:hypothetical protein DPEC_G00046700 [Dallia pectoralis]